MNNQQSPFTQPRDIISVNVNMFKDDILLTCTYSPEINPLEYTKLNKERAVYSFCPELHHLDKLGFKLCTIFRLKRIKSLYVLTKDGSPHSMQIPLMVQEAAEDTGFDKSNIRYFCFEGGKMYEISDLSVRKARHYSEIEKLLPYAKLEKVIEILRGGNGCKNDQKETFLTVIEHLKEEVSEIENAVKTNDMNNLLEEIGDVLFNLALMGQIAKEKELFELKNVVNQVSKKMIDRHPEIFQNNKLKY
ncbi:hypothetical protein KJ980_07825 [Patescibacteria group bacterium]|nr:hypothetical protein [Patescibacteria group bacterium]MBU4015921.1 hypothetical protein [Patescibacteria group bacterium]MBU4099528.1 hypothetical protein [Patescibacteria group bacterium]